jgi:tRNA(Leu) C34 or U34 (ribose-2'-O)-methylase TrmL
MSSSTTTTTTSAPRAKILLYSIGKKQNFGMICRTAVAFGVEQVLVDGSGKVSTLGCQGTNKYIEFVTFDTLDAAVAALRADDFRIVGVEIGDAAVDVVKHPFARNACFIFGNEGTGLNEKAYAVCDQLTYIRQVGNGTASLNVAVAASIVLHHFCSFAGYEETRREGVKYVLDPDKKVLNDDAIARLKVERAARVTTAAANAANGDGDASATATVDAAAAAAAVGDEMEALALATEIFEGDAAK